MRLFALRVRMMQDRASNFSMALAAAALCGGVAVAGWAPLGWWPLALLAYGALYLLLTRVRGTWRAAALGLVFGLALHGVGHGWVFSTLHHKTGLSWIAAALSTAFFATYLAVFTAVPSALFARLRTWRGSVAPLADAALFAALLGAGEYARSLFFNGFTSLSLGHALVGTWFAGLAAVGGAGLVSGAGFFCAALGAQGLRGGTRARWRWAGAVGAVVLAGAGSAAIPWTEPAGSPMAFRLLQVNVAQRDKFDPPQVQRHVQQLVEAIEAGPADLIVTPETAFPQFLNQLPASVLDRLQSFSRESGSHLLLGIATTAPDAEGHNTVLHLDPAPGAAIAQYHKVRLMPFGEYSPWGFGWFTNNLAIPLKDLSAGEPAQPPFVVGAQRLGTLICHEDLVGVEARHWAGPDAAATILVNPSNLAWFEGSLAIAQRLQIVQMRAIETGRPVLRVANTGVTAHIDARGRVVARLPVERAGVLSGRVQGMQGLTPYVRFGDFVFLVLAAVCVLLGGMSFDRPTLLTRLTER